MASKLKMTGFARFFIFLIIATPLIYSGVSIFKGDHPLDALRRDFGIDLRGSQTEQVDDRADEQRSTKNMDKLTREMDKLNEKLDYQREKNERLEMENEELKTRIQELEGQ